MNDMLPAARPTQSDLDRRRHVTGQGRFTPDLGPGALQAFFVRADRAHATLLGIDTAAAAAMPGVLVVLTGDDCVGLNPAPVVNRFRRPDGGGLVTPPRPVLAQGRVRYVGEPVACIIATTLAEAADAAEAIMVDYDDLPPIIGFDAAAAPGAATLHDAAPGNLALHFDLESEPGIADAFAAAAHVVETRIELPRISPTAMETRGVVVRFDDEDGTWHMHSPHQGVNDMRAGMAGILGVATTQILIDPADVGGGFGVRSPAYPEHIALMLAARMLPGQTLRWVSTRTESFLTDHHGRATRLTGRLAMDAKGRFTGIDVQYEADLGAYHSPVGSMVNIASPMQTITGVYAIPVARMRNLHYFTNACPCGPYRGAGRPDIALMVERLVDLAALQLGQDRVALRARNLIPQSAFPYTAPLGAIYDSADLPGLLQDALDAADWQGFAARRGHAAARNALAGIGLVIFTEVSGGGAVPRDEARLTLGVADGAPLVRMETMSGNSGQSHAESFAMIAAPILGLDPADFVLEASAARSTLVGAGSVGSRTMLAVGNSLAVAAEDVRDKLLRQAALRANCAPEDLHLADGAARRADNSAVESIAEIVLALGGEVTALGGLPAAIAYPSGCHIAEVEIDRATGVTSLVAYTAMDDSGVLINPRVAHAQIQGGVVQGIGEVLGEHAMYDRETGAMIAATFMDYPMPKAFEVPNIAVLDRPVPSPLNALGVKGVGEAGTTGALAAGVSAIADALGSVGAALPEIPLTPLRVWQALRDAGALGVG